MASPDIYSRAKGKDFTDTKNPLDKSVGDFEADEPLRLTQRPWGWFPFLYESPGFFNMTDPEILWPDPGGYPVPSIDLWQFPSKEYAGLQVPTPTSQATSDLVATMCTDQTLQNETMQVICSSLAALDGCTWLDDIISKSTASGENGISQLNVLFPNGKTLDWEHLGPFCLAENVWELRAIIHNSDGSINTCSRRYFDPPQGGDGVECTGATASANYEKARDVVIACIKGFALGC